MVFSWSMAIRSARGEETTGEKKKKEKEKEKH